jgi:hypothetical protein
VACTEPYGHAAQPWMTWDLFSDLEHASGNAAAAQAARDRAIAAYLAYRRDGGESETNQAPLLALVAQAACDGSAAAASRQLEALLRPDHPGGATPSGAACSWQDVVPRQLVGILGARRESARSLDGDVSDGVARQDL